MIVFLVGYMGSGKSTIGRALAKRTGYGFMDMDKEIERRCGKTVAEIFATEGERYFRECESELITELAESGGDNRIVATGGGAPCSGRNMEVMNVAGVTIYLKMTPRRLLDRLRHGRDKRPLIKDMDDGTLLEFIGGNLSVRERYYEQASMTIDCDGVSDRYICGHIEEMLARAAGLNG